MEIKGGGVSRSIILNETGTGGFEMENIEDTLVRVYFYSQKI